MHAEQYIEPQEQIAKQTRRINALSFGLGTLVVLVLATAITVWYAVSTAVHWTKTDVPEQPETFRTEEYFTGKYSVHDDLVPICTEGTEWQTCIELLQTQYDKACTTVPLANNSGKVTCDYYKVNLEGMKAENLPQGSYYVAEDIPNGTLTLTPWNGIREVSNGDFKPAKTHSAVCYLGFIGECP